MKEIKITEWIYKCRADKKDKEKQIALKMPKGSILFKGNYLIKIYSLESET